VKENVSNSLPSELQEDPVVDTFVAIVAKVTAKAQVESARAQNIRFAENMTNNESAYQALHKTIDNAPVRSKLTHHQLKTFADKAFDFQMRPGFDAVSANAAANAGSAKAFATYFKSYYEGTFVDKMGQKYEKPKISTTIPDTEIAAAETVLLEYIFDKADTTPVLGDADSIDTITATTNFWPGGTAASKPTALVFGRYKKIDATGCGVTQDNIQYLVDLANGASDRAAAIGGLVANTPGGIVIIGKISIGDNQTLSTLVKTAASRLALRLTYIGTYWALEKFPIPIPTAEVRTGVPNNGF
jgi:hypothetical protein